MASEKQEFFKQIKIEEIVIFMITVDKKKREREEEEEALQERFLAFQGCNKGIMKMAQNLSDRAAQQRTEREALCQQMKDQVDPDKEDLIKALN